MGGGTLTACDRLLAGAAKGARTGSGGGCQSMRERVQKGSAASPASGWSAF